MLLDEKMIKVNVTVDSWREAADAAGEILLENGIIKKGFIEEMKKVVEKFGTYIILSPKIAFFHGPPGEHVIKSGLSLITLEKDVYFREFDNEPISCAFAFAAKDSESHIEILRKLSELLLDGEFLKILLSKPTKEEILAFMEV